MNGTAPCREMVLTVFEDKYKPGIFDRREIYEEVWTQSVTRTAAKYGVGGHHLKKICTALRVPTPSSDYWEQKGRGLTPEISPLPEVKDAPDQVRVVFNVKSRVGYSRHSCRHRRPDVSDETPRIAGEVQMIRCSFCGKSTAEVTKMVQGPKVWICDECVDLCVDVTRSAMQKYTPPYSVGLATMPGEKRLREAFDRLEKHLGDVLEACTNMNHLDFEARERTFNVIKIDTEAVLAILHAGLAVGRLVDEHNTMGQQAVTELRGLVETFTQPVAAPAKALPGVRDRPLLSPDVAQRALRELGISTSRESAQRALADLINHNGRSE